VIDPETSIEQKIQLVSSMIMKSDSDSVQKHFKFDPEELKLKPLKAQVGGHVYMKILNDQFVCKPLNDRELEFYQNIPSNLIDHVPAFKGTLALDNEELYGCRSVSSSTCKDLNRNYIVLENLTLGFKKPCVLDLKMGTRMYSDFATDSKRKSQRKKSKISTSAKLGVRFCGSQRFSVSNDSFEMFDKYVGRQADESELRHLLEKFFTNGRLLRKDVINNVLREICRIKKSLLELEEYRLYSSSILIIYEGLVHQEYFHHEGYSDTENSVDSELFEEEVFRTQRQDSPHSKKDDVKIKIIDFANVSLPSVEGSETLHEGPDRGFLMGLDNLYEILDSLLEEDLFKC